jgi:hypothetical protein
MRVSLVVRAERPIIAATGPFAGQGPGPVPSILAQPANRL